DATTAAVVEEHQIARFQLAAFDLRRVEADHFASRTRQLDTGFLSEQVTDKAAAIETGLDGLAAITVRRTDQGEAALEDRSEEHTSELQSRENLVCRLLLEKK